MFLVSRILLKNKVFAIKRDCKRSLSDSPCQDDYTWFTTVPKLALSDPKKSINHNSLEIKYELDINI